MSEEIEFNQPMKYVENDQVRVMQDGRVWVKIKAGTRAIRGLHTELFDDGTSKPLAESIFVTDQVVIAGQCFQLPESVSISAE